MQDFWNITPNHLLKQYIMHVRYTNPEELNEEKQKEVYYINETPFGR